MYRGQAVRYRNAQANRIPRRVTENPDRQALEERTSRRRGRQAERGGQIMTRHRTHTSN